MDAEVTAKTERAVQALEEMAARLADMSPVTRVFAERLKTAIDRSFDRSVAPFGGAWEALKPATLARKKRLGRSPKPLIGRGSMRNSVFTRGEPAAIKFGVGVNIDYAGYHQFGEGRMERPFLPVARTGEFREEGPMARFAADFRRAVTRWVTKGQRVGG